MSKNRNHSPKSSFLPPSEIQALRLSPREVRRADSAHSEMLDNLSQRKYHRSSVSSSAQPEPANSAANRQVEGLIKFMADWKACKKEQSRA